MGSPAPDAACCLPSPVTVFRFYPIWGRQVMAKLIVRRNLFKGKPLKAAAYWYSVVKFPTFRRNPKPVLMIKDCLEFFTHKSGYFLQSLPIFVSIRAVFKFCNLAKIQKIKDTQRFSHSLWMPPTNFDNFPVIIFRFGYKYWISFILCKYHVRKIFNPEIHPYT